MSVPLFVLARLSGAESYLNERTSDETTLDSLLGRSRHVALLPQVLPRTVLQRLGLSQLLAGTGAGSQALLLIPDQVDAVNELLTAARQELSALSGGRLQLSWRATENLGAWPDVLRRLEQAPVYNFPAEVFAPFDDQQPASAGTLKSLASPGMELRKVRSREGSLVDLELADEGFTLGEDVLLPRHVAQTENSERAATPAELARRAKGVRAYGILRGAIDAFPARLHRATSVEEWLLTANSYTRFFTAEIELLSNQGEFFERVTVLRGSPEDFAVVGSWDALVPFARELHRLFTIFTEQVLREQVGREGRTLSMAISLARPGELAPAALHAAAGRELRLAAVQRNALRLLDHTLDWRAVAEAAALHENLLKAVREQGTPAHDLRTLVSLTGERVGRSETGARPWRRRSRVNRALGPGRNREMERLRTRIANEVLGQDPAAPRDRAWAPVALGWAGLTLGLPQATEGNELKA